MNTTYVGEIVHTVADTDFNIGVASKSEKDFINTLSFLFFTCKEKVDEQLFLTYIYNFYRCSCKYFNEVFKLADMDGNGIIDMKDVISLEKISKFDELVVLGKHFVLLLLDADKMLDSRNQLLNILNLGYKYVKKNSLTCFPKSSKEFIECILTMSIFVYFLNKLHAFNKNVNLDSKRLVLSKVVNFLQSSSISKLTNLILNEMVVTLGKITKKMKAKCLCSSSTSKYDTKLDDAINAMLNIQ